MTKLSKILSFMDIYLFSIGYIIGAGIFILIGKVGKTAKHQAWISFLLAGICALMMSATYVDISYIHQSNFSEMEIIKKTFGNIPTAIITIIIIGIGIFTNSTVSLSMGEALSSIINISPLIISAIIIVFFTFINCLGIRQSAMYNHFSTIIEIGALLFIVGAGFFYKSKIPKQPTTNVPLTNILYSSILAMFAYSGFEATVKLTEEAKDPNDIPKAIVASVVSACILYMLVSLITTKWMTPKELAQSTFPLMDMSKRLMGSSVAKIFFLIGIISISNTLLISILGTSRVLHVIGRDIPELNWLSDIHTEWKTPVLATVIIGLCSIFALGIKNVEKLANITTYLLFIVFAVLNASLIMMYQDNEVKDKLKESWTHNINQGNPILPSLSLLISLGVLCFGALS